MNLPTTATLTSEDTASLDQWIARVELFCLTCEAPIIAGQTCEACKLLDFCDAAGCSFREIAPNTGSCEIHLSVELHISLCNDPDCHHLPTEQAAA